MDTIDISIWGMLGLYSLLLIPIAFMKIFDLGLIKETIFGTLRMSLQLLFVGLYLEFIFALNSWLVNLAWIALMVVMANIATLRRANLSIRKMFPITMLSIGLSAGLVTFFFTAGILAVPPQQARYVIPILGMILGNCMRGNIISLERFYSGIRENETEFITYQLLGANLNEALRPYLRRAINAGMAPYISTMATMGIVSLPGMLTGQILGGSLPMTAIKYQIAIMICIFTASMLASVVNLKASTGVAFDKAGMLRQNIFANMMGFE